MRRFAVGLVVALSLVACGGGVPALESVELGCQETSLFEPETPGGATAEEAVVNAAEGMGTPSLAAEADTRSMWEVYDEQGRLVAAITIEQAPGGEFVAGDSMVCNYVYDRVFFGITSFDGVLDCDEPNVLSYAPPVPGQGTATEREAVLGALAGTSLGPQLSDLSLEAAVSGVLARDPGGKAVGYAATEQHVEGDWFVSRSLNC